MRLKAFLAAFLCLASVAAHAQFTPGQILTAAQLNSQFALKTSNAAAAITGGTINGVSIGQSAAAAGTFTTLSATGVNPSLLFQQPQSGSVSRTYSAKFQDLTDGRDFGMKCDGVTDDTAALQTLINTNTAVHIPTGNCIISSQISVSYAGQLIEGRGELLSTIIVANTFPTTATGVFVWTGSGSEGPIFRDFTIRATQPSTSGMTRSNLISYPPLLYLRGAGRTKIQNMKITECMTCIDMAGGTNAGGTYIDNVEMSAYGVGIDIDGAQDTIRINGFHFWPFDMDSANQQPVYNDGTAIGIRSGRADDLKISNGLFWVGGAASIELISTSSGNTFGEISNTDFDNYGGLVVQSGDINVSNSIFTLGQTTSQAIRQTGGIVSCTGCGFYSSVALTNPMVQLAASGAYLRIANSKLQFLTDMVAIGESAGTAVLLGNQFIPPQSTTPTNSIINVTGGRLTAIGNRALDKGSGSGTFINITADDQHVIADNACIGWGFVYGATISSGYVFGNTACAGSVNSTLGGTVKFGTVNANTLESGGTVINPVLTGTTSSIGGGSLAAGACSTGTVSVSGATTSMSVQATPTTYPGAGFWWDGYVSSAGTVTARVCASVSGTPTASSYNVRILQ